MNCKPGDIAMIVGGIPENHGRLVLVLHRNDHGIQEWVCEALSRIMTRDTKTGPLYWANPGKLGCISDSNLRPIRDPGDDAQDEMLRPLPHEVAA